MHLLDHLSIAVDNLDKARPFYRAIMTALRCEIVYDHAQAIGFGRRCEAAYPDETYIAIYPSSAPIGNAQNHWCFKAQTRAQVDAFYTAAIENGGQDDGGPGLRPHYHDHYYAAFVIDPAGNRLEAVCHHAES